MVNNNWLFWLSYVQVWHEVLDAEHSDGLWFQCNNEILLIKRAKRVEWALCSFNFNKLYVVFRWLVEFGHIELSLDWTIHGLNNLAKLHPLRMGLRFVVEVRLRDGAGQIHLSDVQSDTLKKLSGSVCHEVVLIGL